MRNITLLVIALLIIGAVTYFFIQNSAKLGDDSNSNSTSDTVYIDDSATTVTPGHYVVDTNKSTFNWSGKKPLIDGYVNSGTIDLSHGEIDVTNTTAKGSFSMDMNTLTVGLTAKKPGQENLLEQHLKGGNWFDVTNYPTAQFVITKIEETPEKVNDFQYLITGDLTLKGQTNEITFPAYIYQTDDGLLHTQARFEIDRTKWGLTFGSGSFFQNLGDNLIDDMVGISLSITAVKQ